MRVKASIEPSRSEFAKVALHGIREEGTCGKVKSKDSRKSIAESDRTEVQKSAGKKSPKKK